MNRDRHDALILKQMHVELSPLIEELTAKVCPACDDVCCKQKRCLPDPVDVRYLRALDLPLPTYESDRDPDGPCQFIGQLGCTVPRWHRPWRCTWYFCQPLLTAMNTGPQKTARKIADLIQQIVDIRGGW
jgi:hypothetical protein